MNTENGLHYKKSTVKSIDVGQPVDPAWIATKYPKLTAMKLTALKKILRSGDSIKSEEQDIKDAIGALNRELELLKLRA